MIQCLWIFGILRTQYNAEKSINNCFVLDYNTSVSIPNVPYHIAKIISLLSAHPSHASRLTPARIIIRIIPSHRRRRDLGTSFPPLLPSPRSRRATWGCPVLRRLVGGPVSFSLFPSGPCSRVSEHWSTMRSGIKEEAPRGGFSGDPRRARASN